MGIEVTYVPVDEQGLVVGGRRRLGLLR